MSPVSPHCAVDIIGSPSILAPQHYDVFEAAQYHYVSNVKAKIEGFEYRFERMKILTIKCLEEMAMKITTIVYMITSLCAVKQGDYKIFLKENVAVLSQSQDHWALFGILNFHWSFIDYHLLDHLIDKLCETHQLLTEGKAPPSLLEIKTQMDLHKTVIEEFKMQTTLEDFYQAIKGSGYETKPPLNVSRILSQHRSSIRPLMTLNQVEQFRQSYLHEYSYNLLECSMMLYSKTNTPPPQHVY